MEKQYQHPNQHLQKNRSQHKKKHSALRNSIIVTVPFSGLVPGCTQSDQAAVRVLLQFKAMKVDDLAEVKVDDRLHRQHLWLFKHEKGGWCGLGGGDWWRGLVEGRVF